MEIAEMIAIARRRYLTIIVVTVVGLALGVSALFVLPQRYESRTDVFVTTTGGSTPDQRLSAFTFAQNRARSYAQVVTTPLVLEPVAARLGIPDDAGQLERAVTADVPLDSVVITVRVSDRDPERAQRVATAAIEELITVVPRLEATETPAVDLTVLRPATSPAAPVSPNRRVVLGVSLAAGLLLGSLIAMVRELASGRQRSA